MGKMSSLQVRTNLFSDPLGEAVFCVLGPAPLLRFVIWQSVLSVSHQVGDQCADAVSQIDILGKSLNDSIGLGQGGATFEDKIAREG